MNDILSVYADGGVAMKNPSPIGGSWAWCHVNMDDEHCMEASGFVTPRLSLPLITNNLTEFIALVKGIETLPEGWWGNVCSDSQITLGRFFDGWAMKGIPPVLVRQMHVAKARLDWRMCQPVLHDGHPTKAELALGIGHRGNKVSIHNVWTDKQCKKEIKQYMKTWSKEVAV